MKNFSLLNDSAFDPDRQEFHLFQVKGAKTFATDGQVVLFFPTEEVFGAGVIEDDEELFFDRAKWKDQKMDKAFKIERNPLDGFMAYDRKGKLLGEVLPELTKRPFPDIEATIKLASAAELSLFAVGIDSKRLRTVADSLGHSKCLIEGFKSKPKYLYIKAYDDSIESKGFGMVPGLKVGDNEIGKEWCYAVNVVDPSEVIGYNFKNVVEAKNENYEISIAVKDEALNQPSADLAFAVHEAITAFGGMQNLADYLSAIS